MLEQISHHANIVDNKVLFDKITSQLNILNSEVFAYIYQEDQEGGKNLSIDEIRDINKIVHTNTINKRYIIISKRITNTNIQNALLKLLEEANSNICFIFFVENINTLLPTILSRVNIIDFVLDNNTKNQSLFYRNDNFLNKDLGVVYNDKINSIIKSKKFFLLEDILVFKDYYNKGCLPEKNFLDYLKLL